MLHYVAIVFFCLQFRPFACPISENTEGISIKFGIGVSHDTLSGKTGVKKYRPSLTLM
jgi:hypothetical protein